MRRRRLSKLEESLAKTILGSRLGGDTGVDI